MSQLLPSKTTVGDLCIRALKDAGALGIGQTALAEDITDAWASLQWMLQQWQNERWLVYHLVTLVVKSTGQLAYTVGPGAQINTGLNSTRPDKIESAFLRQNANTFGGDFSSDFGTDFSIDLTTVPGAALKSQQIDYPLELLQSMEDYNRIALKQLVAFPGLAFYDPAWPNGKLYASPVAQANLYSIGITVKEQLPTSFPTLATIINLPFEYYQAIISNLALMLRPKYGLGTYPGDMVPILAKNGLKILRGSNTAIARLNLPADLNRSEIYNIFSDRNY